MYYYPRPHKVNDRMREYNMQYYNSPQNLKTDHEIVHYLHMYLFCHNYHLLLVIPFHPYIHAFTKVE